MDAAHYARLEELFHRISGYSAEARAAVLLEIERDEPELYPHLLRMLEAEQAEAFDQFLDDSSREAPETEREVVSAGDRIGPYRLVRELDRGGMGVVFLAVRDDEVFLKRVAIKILRRGKASFEALERFRRERQILAALDHPRMAKLLDGGTTEAGLPYFVMEYIEDGLALDAYCDRFELDVNQRLRLFLDVCEVVQFAHGNLVIHRDLKPENILVSPGGQVKLLDFGIATLVNPELSSTDSLLDSRSRNRYTPRYASPEQIRGGRMTVASDVYSLGVILFELLTGQSPYGDALSSTTSLLTAICEKDVTLMSTSVGTKAKSGIDVTIRPRRGTRLRGDLDAIVDKALRKRPEQRYSSVAELAADLRFFLTQRPVSARSATARYRAKKFILRNRWAVLASVAIAVVSALAGWRLTAAKEAVEGALSIAEQERLRSEQVSGLLVDLFEIADPLRPGELSAREILEHGAARVESEFAGQVQMQAKLRHTLGKAFTNLGLPDQAIPLLESALATLEAVEEGTGSQLYLETLHSLGAARLAAGDLPQADSLWTRSMQLRRTAYGERSPEVGVAINDLGALRYVQRRFNEANALFAEALRIRRGLGGGHRAALGETLHNLGMTRQMLERPAEAEAFLREALAIRLNALGGEHALVANTLTALANLLSQRDEAEEAERLARQALRILRTELLAGDWRLSVAESVLGGCLADLDRFDEAERLLVKAHDDLLLRQGAEAAPTRRAAARLSKLYERWQKPEFAARYATGN